jgi:hypothetical protein
MNQMIEQYPNRWLGINNIEYSDSTNKHMVSADVVYTDKTASELGMLSLNGQDIEPFFTTPNEVLQMGF